MEVCEDLQAWSSFKMSRPLVQDQPYWFFDISANLRYRYDAVQDQFVYENGMPMPRQAGPELNYLAGPDDEGLQNPSSMPRYGHKWASEMHGTTYANTQAFPKHTPTSPTYGGLPMSQACTQFYQSSEGSVGSPSEPSASSISPQSPASLSSWRSHTTPSRQDDNHSARRDIGFETLGQAFAPLTLNPSLNSPTQQRHSLQRWTQPTDRGNIFNVFDPNSQVMGAFQTEPKEVITDPGLFSQGVTARRNLRETPNEEEKLYCSTFDYRNKH